MRETDTVYSTQQLACCKNRERGSTGFFPHFYPHHLDEKTPCLEKRKALPFSLPPSVPSGTVTKFVE